MNAAALPLWVQVAIALPLVVGALFVLVGAIGLVRFGDFFMRLHAPTKVTTLGLDGVLLAVLAERWLTGSFELVELLIVLFLFATAPVSACLMAMAALHRRSPSVAPLPPELPRE
jgi:multicomponent K+:H+ antiporter subunit G